MKVQLNNGNVMDIFFRAEINFVSKTQMFVVTVPASYMGQPIRDHVASMMD